MLGKMVEAVLDPATSRRLLALRHRGWLAQSGWLRSTRELLPVDREGNPLPWLTYGMIHFLGPRLRDDMRVFEFGCGSSTRWFSARVAEVVSVEHNEAWAALVKEQTGDNVTVMHRDLQDGYIDAPGNHGLFDIVVIDGRRRVDCVPAALASLKPDGVVIWDNSNKAKYAPGMDAIGEQEFRRIEFFGLGPIWCKAWGTTVFYRDDNCLQL